MAKKLTLIMSVFLGAIFMLVGCGNPYKKMKLEISETNVILYMQRDQDGVITEATSQTVDVKVSGAKKGVSTDVDISNSLENIVDIKTIKDGNTTKVTLTAKKAGNAEIAIRTKEGNKSGIINVTVYDKITNLAFEDREFAIANGGTLNLADYLTFTPDETNQKDVTYSLVKESGVSYIEDYATIDENGMLHVDTLNLTTPSQAGVGYDAQKGMAYITVQVKSNFNEGLVSTKRVYVLDMVEADEVVVRSHSDSGKVQLSGTLQTIDVIEDDVQKTLHQVPTYPVVLANNISGQSEFLFSRILEIAMSGDARIDSNYSVTLLQQEYIESDNKFVHVTEMERNTIPNSNYENHTYRFDQISIGQDVLVFRVDYRGFEKMLCTYIAFDMKVQNFATDIKASVSGSLIDPDRQEDKTINVLNLLRDNVLQSTFVQLFTNYDQANKGIKLALSLDATADIDADLWTLVKESVFVYDKDGNAVSLDGKGFIYNGDGVYIYHNLEPDKVQLAKDKISLKVQTVYDLNPIGDDTEMHFPHTVTQSFPLTMHSNVEVDTIYVEDQVKLDITDHSEKLLLQAVPGIYTTKFELKTPTIGAKIVEVSRTAEMVVSKVYLNDEELFTISQKDGTSNSIVVSPNALINTGQVTLFLDDEIHNWSFSVKVIVYAPLAFYSYELEDETVYEFASKVVDELTYRGQWIEINMKEIPLVLGGEVEYKNNIESLTLATTTARDQYTAKTYIPIAIYNYVMIGGEEYQIDITSQATKVTYNTSYMHYADGRIYPYYKQIKHLPLTFYFSGYNASGQEITNIPYTIHIEIQDVVQTFDLVAENSTIYEKSSLGVFDEGTGKTSLNVICYPAQSLENMTVQYNFQDEVVREYKVESTTVSIRISDLMYLNNDGELVADYASTFTGRGKIQQLLTLFGTIENALKDIYRSPINVVVECTIKQSQLDAIYGSTSINLNYAQKVENIVTADTNDQGIYLEYGDIDVVPGNYFSKTIALTVLPTTAYNRNLRISLVGDTGIVDFGQGQVDSEGRIISAGNILTLTPKAAGTATLIIGAEDSYRQTTTAGKYEPDTYVQIRIKVADGSEENPFELSTLQDFLNIQNGYTNGVNTYHYTLANNIYFGTYKQTNPVLFDGSFNGGLNGKISFDETTYIQHTIFDYKADVTTTESVTTFAMFEEFGESAKVENIKIDNMNVHYHINLITNNDVIIGGLVGASKTTIQTPMVTGNLQASISGTDATIGGLVGVVENSGIQSLANTTNYSLGMTISFDQDVIVGGAVGLGNGENNFIDFQGYATIVTNNTAQSSDYTSTAGLFVGKTTGNANIEDIAIQGTANADIVGGLIGSVESATIKNAVIELMDMTDTRQAYGLFATYALGGLVGGVENGVDVSYSYVRSYARTSSMTIGGQDVNYIADLVLQDGGMYFGGLVGYHGQPNVDVQMNSEKQTKFVSSYVDANVYVKQVYPAGTQDSEDMDPINYLGSLVGYSKYFDEKGIFTQVNHLFEYCYAKITSMTTGDKIKLDLCGNTMLASTFFDLENIIVNDETMLGSKVEGDSSKISGTYQYYVTENVLDEEGNPVLDENDENVTQEVQKIEEVNLAYYALSEDFKGLNVIYEGKTDQENHTISYPFSYQRETIEYVQTTDTEPVEGKTYYNQDGSITYEGLTEFTIDVTYYELNTTTTIEAEYIREFNGQGEQAYLVPITDAAGNITGWNINAGDDTEEQKAYYLYTDGTNYYAIQSWYEYDGTTYSTSINKTVDGKTITAVYMPKQIRYSLEDNSDKLDEVVDGIKSSYIYQIIDGTVSFKLYNMNSIRT